MEKFGLAAKARDGKQTPNSLRRAGMIPAVLYGQGTSNVHLMVNEREFNKVLKKAGSNSVVELVDESGKTHPVLIHDVQKHYLTGNTIHIDFYQVDLSQKVRANVPLEFVGTAGAVKALAGTLVKLMSSVEVESLPMSIPHSIEADLGVLETFDSHLTIAMLKVPAGVTLLQDPETVLAKVDAPRDVEAELSTPVVEDVSKVESSKPEKPVEDVVKE